MAVAFVDPRAQTSGETTPYDLGVDLSEGVTIGLLANGFPDSVAFLHHVEAALAGAVPGVMFRHYDKGNASAVASDEMLGSITAECQAVVAAYGH